MLVDYCFPYFRIVRTGVHVRMSGNMLNRFESLIGEPLSNGLAPTLQ